jgi:hypothetical protein
LLNYIRSNCSIPLHIMIRLMDKAEPSNRTLINLKKNIYDHPRHWHKVLSEALWDHRTSKDRGTEVFPFELVYGYEVVLLVEVSLNAVRFAKQNDLAIRDYYNLMMDNIDEVTEKRLVALGETKKTRLWLPNLITRRSPGWEDPYRITQVITGNAYMLQTLQGEDLTKVEWSFLEAISS